MGTDSNGKARREEGPASAAPDAGGEVRASGARECGRCAGSGWEGAVVGALICVPCSGMGLVWPKPMAGVEAEGEESYPPTGENPRNVTLGGVLGWFDR